MSTSEIILWWLLLFGGIYLLTIVRKYENKKKARFEELALEKLDKRLSSISADIQNYKFYKQDCGKWSPSSHTEMRQEIINDCTQFFGDGDFYRNARFCLRIDYTNKKIHYVVGSENIMADFDATN